MPNDTRVIIHHEEKTMLQANLLQCTAVDDISVFFVIKRLAKQNILTNCHVLYPRILICESKTTKVICNMNLKKAWMVSQKQTTPFGKLCKLIWYIDLTYCCWNLLIRSLVLIQRLILGISLKIYMLGNRHLILVFQSFLSFSLNHFFKCTKK